MKKMIQALCLCLLLSVPGLASAAIVTYDFSGVLSVVAGISGPVVGQSFSGSLSYDAGTNLWSSPDGSTRTYSSPLTWQITAGGQQYSSFAQPKPGGQIVTVVFDEYGGAFANDPLFPLASGGKTSISAAPQLGTPEYIGMFFMFNSMRNGEGGRLPSTFEYYYYPSGWPSGPDTIAVRGDITSFSERPVATPLPAAVWLLGSGLVGLAGLRRKFRKA